MRGGSGVGIPGVAGGMGGGGITGVCQTWTTLLAAGSLTETRTNLSDNHSHTVPRQRQDRCLTGVADTQEPLATHVDTID